MSYIDIVCYKELFVNSFFKIFEFLQKQTYDFHIEIRLKAWSRMVFSVADIRSMIYNKW